MEGCDYWEAIEQDYEVALLPNNPTMNHIKTYKDRREFQRMQMKNFESIKEYSDKLIEISNKKSSGDIVILSLYVDDLLVIGSDGAQIEVFKQEMMKVFEMTGLDMMHYFLGMEIKKRQNEVFLCQIKYMREVLKRFNMEECMSVNTPMIQKEKLQKNNREKPTNENVYRSLVRCLMYLTSTISDIMYIVNVLFRFLHCPSKNHMIATKRVLRYLKGTLSFGIKFSKVYSFELQGHLNSDWARTFDARTPLGIVSFFAVGVSHGVQENKI
ncbi:uncharacterized mitochondrial protein AtMg00810-like [Benincasa hispida]|uniref:uncharacterized mitochondrial protein AtMg00810-like n=1 Tax=Benincasa hispida TaxID=102211 RepID=UPI0019005E08|nr:uncharacterized mitochondrial protein AtMg00810-like [Benincasa hispida]